MIIKIFANKIKANQAQYDLDRLTAKISALSSGELRKYLGYRSSVLEQTKFDYSPLGKVFNKGLHDKDDKKEGLLKRLKNIEEIKKSIIMTKTKKTNNKSESSSVKSELSKKTSVRDDELEKSVYSPNKANMEGIDILGSEDESQTSYLKDDFEVLFLGYPDIFDSDLKNLFKILHLKKKRISITNYFQEKLQHRLKKLIFLQKHGNLYDFLTNVLKNTNLNQVRSLQVKFLDDLMNGSNVYKKIKGANSTKDLYLCLLGNPNRTGCDLFLKTPTDKYNKEIYLQAQKLFSLRESIF